MGHRHTQLQVEVVEPRETAGGELALEEEVVAGARVCHQVEGPLYGGGQVREEVEHSVSLGSNTGYDGRWQGSVTSRQTVRKKGVLPGDF